MPKFTLELEWTDKSSTFAEISVDGKPHEFAALLQWICRGSLMASNCDQSVVWDDQGFEFCAYRR